MVIYSSELDSVEGSVLAGGKSTRMGSDKATIMFDGKLFIENIISVMKRNFSLVNVISSNPEHKTLSGVKVYPDLEEGRGPLGGILTALYYSKAPFVFCSACDMPFLSTEIINLLVNERLGWDVVVPKVNGRLHPLCGVYNKSCIPIITAEINSGELKIINFYKKVRVKILSENFFEQVDSLELSLSNINTPKDLETAKKHDLECF